MTGATRGIGEVALRHLVAQTEPGTRFVLLARDPAGSALAQQLRAQGAGVLSIPADLSSMSSVLGAARAVADAVAAGDLPPLSAIVGNAGIQHVDDTTETDEGLEETFAVNVLANYVLIEELRPHLRPRSRIVITVSDTHFGDFRHNMGMVPGPAWPEDPARLASIRTFDRPESVSAGRTAYSTSKLAAIYLVHEYARRLPEGVDIVGYNPGFVPGTGLARNAGALSRFAVRRILPLMTLTPLATGQRAAGKHLADAVLGRIDVPSGGYIDRNRVVPSSSESYDEKRERQLWETLERLTA
nr:SDR family NAD(P)-dependent oxidoreductase [Gordonia araii]